MRHEDPYAKLMVSENRPVMEHADEANYRFERFCDPVVGSRRKEIPRSGENNLADHISRKVVT